MAAGGSEGNVIIPQESADAIKQNLRAVADELTRVRDRAREEADSLDRIRGMLDLKYLNDLLSVIDQLESRVKQMEKGVELKRWRTELDNEQKRLAKLWDAFKTQEDQVRALERERDEALLQYRNLEKTLAELGSPSKIRGRIIELEAENRRLEAEGNVAATRLERYVNLFQKEQERLAKLYKVYEDTESKLAALTPVTSGAASSKKGRRTVVKSSPTAAKASTRRPPKRAAARRKAPKRARTARKAAPRRRRK